MFATKRHLLILSEWIWLNNDASFHHFNSSAFKIEGWRGRNGYSKSCGTFVLKSDETSTVPYH